ncbi:hypothetical protein C8Q76DRAFT_793608 [Earliella scabrosa]|nr:hypothetical protein C8Q76DRAFT_793608 [Earliella scabrosa]
MNVDTITALDGSATFPPIFRYPVYPCQTAPYLRRVLLPACAVCGVEHFVTVRESLLRPPWIHLKLYASLQHWPQHRWSCERTEIEPDWLPSYINRDSHVAGRGSSLYALAPPAAVPDHQSLRVVGTFAPDATVQVQILPAHGSTDGGRVIPNLTAFFDVVERRRILWFGADLRLLVDPLHVYHGQKKTGARVGIQDKFSSGTDGESILVLKSHTPPRIKLPLVLGNQQRHDEDPESPAVVPLSASQLHNAVHLDDDVCAVLVDEMDMPTLVCWRATCRETYKQTVRSLKKELEASLRLFLPCPHNLLRLTTQHHALIGGEFALNAVLRRDGLDVGRMDVFVNNAQFDAFVQSLKRDPVVAPELLAHRTSCKSATFAHARDVRRCEIFRTSTRKLIYVFESFGVSACSAIARTWCTALMNFVTEFSIGCAYPRLTLAKQALLSDLRIPGLADEDYITMARMVEAGFDFADEATQFPPYFRYANPDSPPGIFPCLADFHICPDQGRHFGDRGALVLFLNPLGGDITAARLLRVAPFGFMATWRMWCTHSCDQGCADVRTPLPRGMISMPSVFTAGAVFFPTLHRALLHDQERSGRSGIRVRRLSM